MTFVDVDSLLRRVYAQRLLGGILVDDASAFTVSRAAVGWPGARQARRLPLQICSSTLRPQVPKDQLAKSFHGPYTDLSINTARAAAAELC